MFEFLKRPKVNEIWLDKNFKYEARVIRVQDGRVTYNMLSCQCQCSIKEFKRIYEKTIQKT